MQTEHLKLRQLNLNDLDDFYEIVGDERVADDITPIKSKEEVKKIILDALNDTRFILFALELKESGKMIGAISLKITEEQVGKLSSVLHPDYWNKGYGSEAMIEVEKIAMEQMKLKKLCSECNLFNSSCAQLYKTVLGFDYIKTEQVDGKDVLFFEKSKSTYDKSKM